MTETAAPYTHAVLLTAPDANVERVRAKLLMRSQVGLQKYGVTTERNDLDLLAWGRHLQEELLDAAVYVERIMSDLQHLSVILKDAKRSCTMHMLPPVYPALHLIDPAYDLAVIERELELHALEIGDLEK